MGETILIRQGKEIVEHSREDWERGLQAHVSAHAEARLSFMSSEHHLVRYFVVRELPRLGRAIPPAVIAQELDLPLQKVIAILDELEKGLFFLFRNEGGDVAWAYPVTVDRTPHQIAFDSGQQLYAA
jgi:predicted Rossmann fold nucleotide-binding protein DprA/Smf involved in DNA uptake